MKLELRYIYVIPKHVDSFPQNTASSSKWISSKPAATEDTRLWFANVQDTRLFWSDEMVQQVEALAAKPDNMDWIPGTLWLFSDLHKHIKVHTSTQINKINYSTAGKKRC